MLPDVYAKRSSVLVAVVLGAKSAEQADTLLSRVEYEARITWNEIPPPSPIKPLYQLFTNIIYLSVSSLRCAWSRGLCMLACEFIAAAMVNWMRMRP